MSKGSGSSGSKKQLGLIFASMVLLLLFTPSAGIIPAIVLLAFVVWAVVHNGVQVFDCIVFFAVGVFCASTFAGQGTNSIVNTIAGWVSQVVA